MFNRTKYFREWRRRNPQKWREYQERYRGTEKYKETYKGYYREYYANHKEQFMYHRRRREARKRGADEFHTYEEWEGKKREYGGRCALCGANARLTEDHIIPLSKGGSDSISNIQPLCLSCNCSKGAKVLSLAFR